MADKKKYYTALGLRDGASQIEIKNAYKNLVLIYHPDVNENSGDYKKMLEINEAYDKLFNRILYNKEMNDLNKDPDAYHDAHAKYPLAFVPDDDEKPVTHPPKGPDINTGPKGGVKKKDDGGSGLASFCLGGFVVALIIAFLSFPPFLIIGVIAIVAYFLLK